MRSINEAPAELADSVREFFPPEEWDHAVSIAYIESGWDAFAENDSTRHGVVPCGTPIEIRQGVTITAEHSIGWFQINACNFPDWPWERLFNTRHNVGTAHMLWAERGWSPWYFSARLLLLL